MGPSWTSPVSTKRGPVSLGLAGPPQDTPRCAIMGVVTTTVSGELAGCLRSWRERLSPADVGLPADGHRRVAGLRREEVAQLAGVSMDYLTRLEQGRATSPSAS